VRATHLRAPRADSTRALRHRMLSARSSAKTAIFGGNPRSISRKLKLYRPRLSGTTVTINDDTKDEGG